MKNKNNTLRHLISLLKKNIVFAFKEVRLSCFVFSGKDKITGKQVITLYVTSHEVIPYFISQIYKEQPAVIEKRSIYFWQLQKLINRMTNRADLMLIDLHCMMLRLLKTGNAFRVPIFVRQRLNVNRPVEEIIRSFRKNTKSTELRKIRKFGYTFDVFNDDKTLRFFYENMHIPYIRNKYTDDAVIDHFDSFKKIYNEGELLLIKNSEQYVSGVLCEKKNDLYFWQRVGLLNGDLELLKKGALAATYYFAILRAREKNAAYIDFGRSRPFLSDGVLRYKNKWGAIIHTDESNNRYICIKPNFQSSAFSFFYGAPFICMEKNECKAVAFSLTDKTDNQQPDIYNNYTVYRRSGISSFKTVQLP